MSVGPRIGIGIVFCSAEERRVRGMSDILARDSGPVRRRGDGAAYRTRTCDPRITNAGKGRKTAVSREVRTKRSGN